jgi:hypothetical protein
LPAASSVQVKDQDRYQQSREQNTREQREGKENRKRYAEYGKPKPGFLSAGAIVKSKLLYYKVPSGFFEKNSNALSLNLACLMHIILLFSPLLQLNW